MIKENVYLCYCLYFPLYISVIQYNLWSRNNMSSYSKIHRVRTLNLEFFEYKNRQNNFVTIAIEISDYKDEAATAYHNTESTISRSGEHRRRFFPMTFTIKWKSLDIRHWFFLRNEMVSCCIRLAIEPD